MMDKSALVLLLTEKLAEKTPLTVAQLFNALESSTPEAKQQLTDAVNLKNGKLIAELILKLGNKKRRNLANTRVMGALADDTITTAELLEIF